MSSGISPATHQNVMVVGDDAQSIYAFRGATFKNIMEFPSLFPGTIIYKLEENYRSTQPILNLANSIIEEATEKYTKHLFTRKIDGPLPALVEAAGRMPNRGSLRRRFLEFREEGVPLSEMAVLFRRASTPLILKSSSPGKDCPLSSAEESNLLRPHMSKICWPICGWWPTPWIRSAGIACSCWLKEWGQKRRTISWPRW